MKNLPLLIGTILGTIILVFGVVFMFSKNTQNEFVPADPAIVEGAKRNSTGSAESTVKIVEFSDFQCPACRATEPLVELIREDYSDKVEFVYRHFPLVSLHPNAQMAAQAAEVAADYNLFWEYHQLLFSRQADWEALSSQDAIDAFGIYAQELEIDKEEFLSKIQSDDVKNRVARDVSDATQLKVNSTPTFYVNGVKTSAPQLIEAVEAALSEKVQE